VILEKSSFGQNKGDFSSAIHNIKQGVSPKKSPSVLKRGDFSPIQGQEMAISTCKSLPWHFQKKTSTQAQTEQYLYSDI
jgi:hypothetical protein